MIRVLADPSRHAVYQELVDGRRPATVGDIAERLDLHPSTVRLHLEKLRDAGLVDAAPDRHGSVGRPHLLWSVRSTAPALGLEPDGMRMLAHLLADLAALDPVAALRAGAVGRRRGDQIARAAGDGPGPARPASGGERPQVARALEEAVAELARLGFDPTVETGGDREVISFAGCPFRELAVVYPDLVCQLHRGMTEALIDKAGATLEGFSTLVDPDPCRAEVSMNA